MERGDAPRPPRRRIGHDELRRRHAERGDRDHGAARLSPRGGRAHEGNRDVAVPRRVERGGTGRPDPIRWWRRRACCSTRAGGSKSSGLVGTRAPGICCRWDCSTRTATASTRWSRAGSSGRPSTDIARGRRRPSISSRAVGASLLRPRASGSRRLRHALGLVAEAIGGTGGAHRDEAGIVARERLDDLRHGHVGAARRGRARIPCAGGRSRRRGGTGRRGARRTRAGGCRRGRRAPCRRPPWPSPTRRRGTARRSRGSRRRRWLIIRRRRGLVRWFRTSAKPTRAGMSAARAAAARSAALPTQKPAPRARQPLAR